jgi:hypothetical protein
MIQYLHNIFKILIFDSILANILQIFKNIFKIFSKYFDCLFPNGGRQQLPEDLFFCFKSKIFLEGKSANNFSLLRKVHQGLAPALPSNPIDFLPLLLYYDVEQAENI